MKKVFGILMLLFLFVGISLATNGQKTIKTEPMVTTVSMGTDLVIAHTDLVIVEKSETVLKFVGNWLSDNYSSESEKPNAGLLQMVSINYKTNTVRFYTTDNFDIMYQLIGQKLSIYTYYQGEGNPDKQTVQRVDTITKQFRTDFTIWRYQLE